MMNSDQAIAMLGYLRHAFGSWEIPDDEARPYLRLFVHLDERETRAAIDAIVRSGNTRRPSVAEIVSQVRRSRPAVADTRACDPLPDIDPAAVTAHVARIKAEAGLR